MHAFTPEQLAAAAQAAPTNWTLSQRTDAIQFIDPTRPAAAVLALPPPASVDPLEAMAPGDRILARCTKD